MWQGKARATTDEVDEDKIKEAKTKKTLPGKAWVRKHRRNRRREEESKEDNELRGKAEAKAVPPR